VVGDDGLEPPTLSV